jgi:hypothetical protein
MFNINNNYHPLLYYHLCSYLFSAVENGAILIESYLAILIKEYKGKRIYLISSNITFPPYPCSNII